METKEQNKFETQMNEFNDFLDDIFPGCTKEKDTDEEGGFVFTLCPQIGIVICYRFEAPREGQKERVRIEIQCKKWDKDLEAHFCESKQVFEGQIDEHFVIYFSKHWRNFQG